MGRKMERCHVGHRRELCHVGHGMEMCLVGHWKELCHVRHEELCHVGHGREMRHVGHGRESSCLGMGVSTLRYFLISFAQRVDGLALLTGIERLSMIGGLLTSVGVSSNSGVHPLHWMGVDVDGVEGCMASGGAMGMKGKAVEEVEVVVVEAWELAWVPEQVQRLGPNRVGLVGRDSEISRDSEVRALKSGVVLMTNVGSLSLGRGGLRLHARRVLRTGRHADVDLQKVTAPYVVFRSRLGPFVHDCETERWFLCCVVWVGCWRHEPVVCSRVVASFFPTRALSLVVACVCDSLVEVLPAMVCPGGGTVLVVVSWWYLVVVVTCEAHPFFFQVKESRKVLVPLLVRDRTVVEQWTSAKAKETYRGLNKEFLVQSGVFPTERSSKSR
ncbi:hypothetical protein Taro_046902 [Colocasia esculenta]|uniref:Uncharacterized protein n=1 Tax=Colocasia esculenta TaxID=4460 RepID=A0A843X011_COLES|nr:hypothetical protein [Colocasia esculenta]